MNALFFPFECNSLQRKVHLRKSLVDSACPGLRWKRGAPGLVPDAGQARTPQHCPLPGAAPYGVGWGPWSSEHSAQWEGKSQETLQGKSCTYRVTWPIQPTHPTAEAVKAQNARDVPSGWSACRVQWGQACQESKGPDALLLALLPFHSYPCHRLTQAVFEGVLLLVCLTCPLNPHT